MGASFSDDITTIRPGQTVEDAFAEVHSSRGHESGYQYSGTLSMKGSAWVIGKSQTATPAQFKMVCDLISQYVENEDELFAMTSKIKCKECWGDGKQYTNVGATTDDGERVTVNVRRECAACQGTGGHSLNEEELAAEKQRIVDLQEALKLFGISRTILTRAREIADDKWESQAIGIVCGDQAWFGATCPS